jgi:hypothetical protein
MLRLRRSGVLQKPFVMRREDRMVREEEIMGGAKGKMVFLLLFSTEKN